MDTRLNDSASSGVFTVILCNVPYGLVFFDNDGPRVIVGPRGNVPPPVTPPFRSMEPFRGIVPFLYVCMEVAGVSLFFHSRFTGINKSALFMALSRFGFCLNFRWYHKITMTLIMQPIIKAAQQAMTRCTRAMPAPSRCRDSSTIGVKLHMRASLAIPIHCVSFGLAYLQARVRCLLFFPSQSVQSDHWSQPSSTAMQCETQTVSQTVSTLSNCILHHDHGDYQMINVLQQKIFLHVMFIPNNRTQDNLKRYSTTIWNFYSIKSLGLRLARYIIE